MKPDMGETLRLIEKLRHRLEVLAVSRGTLNDPEVLAASQKLDIAVSHYLSICRDQDKNGQPSGIID
ncbi:MAG: Spo0E family sporulation regulatory protein-aspartic acid phosphatase [Deltaproteobacteria bacterium]